MGAQLEQELLEVLFPRMWLLLLVDAVDFVRIPRVRIPRVRLLLLADAVDFARTPRVRVLLMVDAADFAQIPRARLLLLVDDVVDFVRIPMGAILWRGQLDFGDVPGDVPEGAERWLQLGVGEVQVGDVPEVLERDLQV